jgi:hypothetical protein
MPYVSDMLGIFEKQGSLDNTRAYFYVQKQTRPGGFEPSTLGSEDQCSNPLSYGRLRSNYRLFAALCLAVLTECSRTFFVTVT